MIRLENGTESPENKYAKTSKVVSSVKTGGSILIAAAVAVGFAAKQAPRLAKLFRKK